MEAIKKTLQNSFVQIIIVFGGLIVTLVNLYISTLTTPLANDIGIIRGKAEANELKLQKVDSLNEEVIILKTNQTNILAELRDISTDVKLLIAR